MDWETETVQRMKVTADRNARLEKGKVKNAAMEALVDGSQGLDASTSNVAHLTPTADGSQVSTTAVDRLRSVSSSSLAYYQESAMPLSRFSPDTG